MQQSWRRIVFKVHAYYFWYLYYHDATFGQNGVALIDLPHRDYYEIQQFEQGADGSILINGFSGSGYTL